jgi:hypothetical protein
VLREVARLQAAHPWTLQPLETVIPADPHGAERAALEVQIAAARREIGKNIRLLKLIDDPDPDTLASFRRDNRALSDEIAALEVRRDALPRPSIDLAALEALRDRLARTDMAALIAGLREHNDVAGLRELVAATVQSARITERVGGARNGGTGWVRAAVEWTPDVALLLEHGCLVLGPAPQAPPMPSPAERTAARMRAYRARRRAQRAAPAPAVPGDLLSVAEAARVLGCSEEGIRAAVRRGTLGAVSLERRPPRTFITREEIERYRTTRLGKPGPKSGPKPQVDA